MPRTPRVLALHCCLLIAALIDPSRGHVARAQASVSFEQADSRRLTLKEGTADRADAALEAARLAGERAWQLYRRSEPADAALWLDRQVRLQAEHYAIWSGILDADFKALDAQTDRMELLVDDVPALRALWQTSLEVRARARKANGVGIEAEGESDVARLLRTMTRVDDATFFAVVDFVSGTLQENRDAAGLLARKNGDGPRELAAARQGLELAREALGLPLDGLGPNAPNLRLISLAAALETLGRVEGTRARFAKAEEHYTEALSVRRKISEGHPGRRLHETFGLFGRLYREVGQLDDAREAFEQALASIARQPKASDATPMGRVSAAIFDDPSDLLRDLGELSELQGNFAGALERYRTAEIEASRVRDIVNAAAASEPQLDGWSRNKERHVLHIRTLAPLLRARMGEIDTARLEVQGLVNGLLALGESSSVTAVLTARVGMLDLATGRGDRASASFTLALSYFDAARHREGAIYARMALARSLERLGRLEEAGTHAEAAFGMATEPGLGQWRARAAIASARIRVMRGIGEGVDERLEIVRQADPLLSAEDRAAGFVVAGMRQEQLRQKPAALAHYRQAVAHIEHLRAEPFSQSRFYDSESHYEPYERLIGLLLDQGDVAEAFHYTLMTRTKELRQTHDDALASARPALQQLFTDERTLREKIQALAAAAPQSFQGMTPSDEAVVANELAVGALVQQWRTVTAAIAGAEPAYSLFANTPSLTDVQTALAPDTALVVYVAPRDEALQIFVVTRDRARVVRSPVLPADLWSEVAELRRQSKPTQAIDINRRRDRLRKLYDVLIAPVQGELQGIDRLAILPSRALHYVPFPALLRRTGSQDRFLIEDKEIVQLSGAAFSALQNDRRTERRPPATSTLAAVADPANNLPGALGEVEHVRTLFPAARVLSGDEATSRGLHGVLEGASVFHYAGHAWPDPRMPGAGYLELAQPNTPEGRLTVNEIRGLPMAGMELVTLSACEASQGQGEPRGLAITSLSDAFLMAGAHSVIGTLWKVDDGGTRELMGEFYRRLTAGSCKGVSLREAQLALLRGGTFADPYYWAAFSLFGDWGDLSGRRASCAVIRR